MMWQIFCGLERCKDKSVEGKSSYTLDLREVIPFSSSRDLIA